MTKGKIVSGLEEFTRALAFVLRWEGSYVNHPADRGGATNQGITQKTYDAYRRGQGLPARSVAQLDDSEMRVIYFENYWEAGRCPFLAWPACLVHFDACVNHGVALAVKLLQRTVGAAPDGRFGPKTQAAICAREPLPLALDYIGGRRVFYHEIVRRNASQGIFLKGWLNRMEALAHAASAPLAIEAPS